MSVAVTPLPELFSEQQLLCDKHAKFIYTCANWPYVQQHDEQNLHFLLFNKMLQICFICPDPFSLTSPGTIIWKVIIFYWHQTEFYEPKFSRFRLIFCVFLRWSWQVMPPKHCRSTPQSFYNLSALSLCFPHRRGSKIYFLHSSIYVSNINIGFY